MKNRQILILGLILGIALAGALGYYFFEKPTPSASGMDAAFTLTSGELFDAFNENEEVANAKYLNQVLEVQGKLADKPVQSDSVMVLVLGSGMGPFGVSCAFAGEEIARAQAARTGEEITIKGICSGFLGDVNLTQCAVVQ